VETIMTRLLLAVAFSLLGCCSLSAQEKSWQAGLAKIVITPTKPMWMSGYASRTKPADGKITELWAKACLLKSPAGQQALVISLDLVGVDRKLAHEILAKLEGKLNLKPEQIALATSHTHSGPVVGNNLRSMYVLEPIQQKLIDKYTSWLQDRIVQVADEARRNLQPAKLSWTIGQATFAVNRRNNKEADIEKIRGEGTLQGPVDHDVPVLAIRDAKDKLVGVLFGYACHATVLSGYDWCGDYPGFAMGMLEQDYPGAIAIFWAGCGADQNPLPRRTVALAKKYGQELAASVNDALKKPLTPLKGTELRTVQAEVAVPYDVLPSREQLAKDALSTNRYAAARAQLWLDRLAKGEKLPETYPYPVQVWRLGDDLTWVTLGGEVVVDFSLRLKKELTPGKTWVMGYANDVMAYIPSLRVLKEGGYEGGGAMLYYGLPAIWGPQVEEVIVEAVRKLAKSVR